jgi:hypothetical protein
VYPSSTSGCLIEWEKASIAGLFITYMFSRIFLVLKDRTTDGLVMNSLVFTAKRLDDLPKLKQNEWNFVSVVYDYANKGRLSITVDDATFTVETSEVKASTNGQFVHIGHTVTGGDDFKGKMSCVMVWNQVLTVDDTKRVKKFCFDNNRIATIGQAFMGCEY